MFDGLIAWIKSAARWWMRDIRLFSRIVARRPLRSYQLEVAQAIVDSVVNGRGLTFAVAMSRQAGKNETQAQLEAFLLNWYRSSPGAQIVKAAPTFKPQTINSLMRLERTLSTFWTQGQWRREHGYIVRLGQARILFFSAQPGANVVGATASLLLECDEAQDVVEEKWNKDFRPMAAATNATTVLWGTVWTSRTLLGKAIRSLRQLEAQDGVRRVFLVPWERAAQDNPAYGVYVRGEIARLGRNHPLIKTQYFLEEIDAEGGMFPEQRQAQMKGDHPRRYEPEEGKRYVMTIDVAGETEEAIEGAELREREPRKDSTALLVAEVVTERGQPHYRVVNRRLWTGTKHADLFCTLLDLARLWRAEKVVIDATGVGAGLASFLAAELGERVVQKFIFTARAKSDLGWSFLAICDSGRYKEYGPDGLEDTTAFWQQVDECEYEVLDGPAKMMRWGVEDPTIHDDLVISAALLGALEGEDWTAYSPAAIVEAPVLDWDAGDF